MSRFFQRLQSASPDRDAGDRRWIYVPYDQLTDQLGPLAETPASETGIVLVETRWKAERRSYHRQKLALILSNQRHFALEQAERGVAVRYLIGARPYGEMLSEAARELGSLSAMEPAERELRADLAPLVEDGCLELLPHEGWLTSEEQFESCRDRNGRYRMDAFYRRARRDRDLLVKDGKPVGGQWSFDSENRKPWKGEPEPPEPPCFEVDEVTEEVAELVAERFSDHPGQLRPSRLPASKEDAEEVWSWAKEHCFESFGPFEDAMTTRSSGLFHTRVSQLLNLHRLLPSQVIEEAVALDAPLQSREGFLRQILGWREFVRWIHRRTDGFRKLPAEIAGEAYSDPGEALDAEVARPSFLRADRELPAAFWGDAPSGLRCLDHVVEEVWREGYSHHITRLMVLSNLATLLDVSPRELTDWFWVAYTDAFDWVVEPNVLGMGTYAVGDLMTTKPYVSGSNYIHKMSDYCDGCSFHPKRDCPIASLYWQFLARHRPRLEGNPRMNLALKSAEKRESERGEDDRRVFEWVTETLGLGRKLEPGDQPLGVEGS